MKKINCKLPLACLLFSCMCYSTYSQEANRGIDIEELQEKKVVIEETREYEERPFVKVEHLTQKAGLGESG